MRYRQFLRSRQTMFRSLAILGTMLLAADLRADDKIGIRVPPGFEVSLYADDDLAHDIYSMTIDVEGRVVVSGAGYIRILIDEDGDGKAETYKQFVDGPASGAQGMSYHGRDLLCTGDEGLILYRDHNEDDRADGPPEVFLKIKTGSEHHAHAIQRGPDGWWYLIAGNLAEVTEKYVTLETSPIRKPVAGTVMRFTPDLAGGEIVADGFRNAYDFAFHSGGGLYVFDSDGERDVSLPWYQPTRVFHALPGSNAGWVSRSWKRPGYFPNMPPVVAAAAEFGKGGRGSPTGVVCYRHHQFPRQFQDALFVLDWTFGRVMAIPLNRNGSIWRVSDLTAAKPVEFMSSLGQFGFAPTDAAVGPDGSLYVCVGGRGTRGSVYRVRYTGEPEAITRGNTPSLLATCLDAPQPLSSWSRKNWVPLAQRLGRRRFIAAGKDTRLALPSRLRAIEILTDLFGGVDTITLLDLATDESPEIRARAVWSAGRTGLIARHPTLLLPFFNDRDPLVVRIALETLIGNRDAEELQPLSASLGRLLAAKDRYVRQTATRVVSQFPPGTARTIADEAGKHGTQAEVAYQLARAERTNRFHSEALETGVQVLSGDHPAELKLEAARLVQLALGDVGPQDTHPPAFDSYASQIDLVEHQAALKKAAETLAPVFPIGQKEVDVELARVLAMLAPTDGDLLDRIVAKIDDESHPVDDLHQLLVASRIAGQRTAGQQAAIAGALVALDAKVAARNLKLDSNWDPRIAELYAELTKHDPDLPQTIIRRPDFGRPGQVIFLSQLSKADLPAVVAAYEKAIRADDDYAWNNDVVFLMGASDKTSHRRLVREQFGSYGVRDAVLVVLARNPQEEDRDKFVSGLSSSQLPALNASVGALSELLASDAPTEQFALLRSLRTLGANKAEFELREQVVRLLRRNLKQDFGFQFGTEGHQPQAEVIGKWTDYLSGKYPEVAPRELAGGGNEVATLKDLLTSADWSQGDAERGRKLFEKRSCVQCHGGRQALGPDLAGVAKRFSRDDLFVAIAAPNRDVSPRYQTTLVETKQGKVYTGLVIYESVDGILLRDAANQTYRIEAGEIETQQTRPTSLMPAGLLKDLQPAELADLYQYIQGL